MGAGFHQPALFTPGLGRTPSQLLVVPKSPCDDRGTPAPKSLSDPGLPVTITLCRSPGTNSSPMGWHHSFKKLQVLVSALKNSKYSLQLVATHHCSHHRGVGGTRSLWCGLCLATAQWVSPGSVPNPLIIRINSSNTVFLVSVALLYPWPDCVWPAEFQPPHRQKHKTYAISGKKKKQFICSKFHNSLISILCRLLISHFLC